MDTVTISQARKFSLREVKKNVLLEGEVNVWLICFEAGQRDEVRRVPSERIYQVLEGEALIKIGEESGRLGKGKLLRVPKDTSHSLENAGGGLLVVMATSCGGHG